MHMQRGGKEEGTASEGVKFVENKSNYLCI